METKRHSARCRLRWTPTKKKKKKKKKKKGPGPSLVIRLHFLSDIASSGKSRTRTPYLNPDEYKQIQNKYSANSGGQPSILKRQKHTHPLATLFEGGGKKRRVEFMEEKKYLHLHQSSE